MWIGIYYLEEHETQQNATIYQSTGRGNLAQEPMALEHSEVYFSAQVKWDLDTVDQLAIHLSHIWQNLVEL